VIDEAGNVKEQMPQNPDDEVDIFTAWVLVLREDDMLGYDAVYNNMSYNGIQSESVISCSVEASS
ncbi:MAG: hypothetical protein IJ291_00220, partial [Lachnospiraceae bacterium]|nr:hypothetical protein [Lachnospiraceae bacterium]